jgi:AcrR family transcriptional regulator
MATEKRKSHRPRPAGDKPAAASPPGDKRDPVVAALHLAATQGWSATTMNDIARESGVKLADLLAEYPTKASLVAALQGRMDAAMLAGWTGGDDETTQDRLFDAIMRRFDAMRPHKDGIRAIMRDLRFDPAGLCAAACGARRTLDWIMAAADADRFSLMNCVRRAGVALAYGDALRAWLDDDTPDMAKTMARLDRGLRRALSLARFAPGAARPDAPAAEAQA